MCHGGWTNGIFQHFLVQGQHILNVIFLFCSLFGGRAECGELATRRTPLIPIIVRELGKTGQVQRLIHGGSCPEMALLLRECCLQVLHPLGLFCQRGTQHILNHVGVGVHNIAGHLCAGCPNHAVTGGRLYHAHRARHEWTHARLDDHVELCTVLVQCLPLSANGALHVLTHDRLLELVNVVLRVPDLALDGLVAQPEVTCHTSCPTTCNGQRGRAARGAGGACNPPRCRVGVHRHIAHLPPCLFDIVLGIGGHPAANLSTHWVAGSLG